MLAQQPLMDQVAELRSKFFTGPIQSRLDLNSLDPTKRPDSAQIGAIAHLDPGSVQRFPWMTPQNLLPYAVAAGIKWLRTAYNYQDWDWSINQPTDVLKSWVTAEMEAGIKPLFVVGNGVNIGTSLEISGGVDMVQAVIGAWGEDVGAFQFFNEPNNTKWKTVYGGLYWGGPWVGAYARFVEQASRQIKAEHPGAQLVNGEQMEEVTITQLKGSSPILDAVDVHHYPHQDSLAPEYDARTVDPNFPDFATSDSEFERAMSDYLRQASMLTGNSKLQLWMTETGAPSVSNQGFLPNTLDPMSPTQQAKLVARLLVLGFIATSKTFIYAVADPRPATQTNDFGLVTPDLATPKPAYFVLGRISALTGGRATLDPSFQAVVTRASGSALPIYVNQAGGPNSTLMKESLRAERFTTVDGKVLVAVWSTHPPREKFQPRVTTFTVNKPLGADPMLVDPLTGESSLLQIDSGVGGNAQFTLPVRDYPQFIIGG